MKDLLMVDAVDEDHVVDELVQRYRQGYVYTFLGPVLIAMNPYKLLKQKDGSSIYARNMIDEFSGKEMHLAEPHPFAIAEAAYSNLMRFGTDQSLLITGESGSGKTETSKHVMQYLTTISTRSRAKSAVIANRRMSVAQKKEADEMTSHDAVIEGVDDAAEFPALVRNLTAVGVTRDEQDAIFEQLSAILWIGNIRFRETTDEFHNKVAALADDAAREALETAAALLGVEAAALEAMLTFRIVNIYREDQKVLFDARQAKKVCHSIARTMYENIFSWIVARINANVSVAARALIERYNAAHSGNAHYVRSRIQGPHFSIVHYAGKVEYDVTLFFEANVDTFFNDLHAGMAKSANAFVRDVFKDTRSSEETKKRPPSTSQQFRAQAHSMRKAAIDLLTTPSIGVLDAETQELVPFAEDSATLGCFSLGRNRIFLRHPQALSALEVLREHKIPDMVGIIENAWRRYKNRLALTKFLAAERELAAAYKAVSTNCQDRRKRRAGANDKATIAALYATWEAVSTALLHSENRLTRQLAADERDNGVIFAQSLVRAALERRAFLRLKRAQIVFSKRYRGLKTRKQMAADMWKSCKKALLGVRTEFERYMGKKKRRRNTLDREYKGDYIGVNTYPAYASLLSAKGGASAKLLFLGHVQKVNERFVHQARVLMISSHAIFNLKADKIHQPKERRVVELTRLSGVAMSAQPDNYLLLQVKGDADLLVVVEQKTEIVNALRKRILAASGRELPVTIADSLEFMAVKGKPQTLKFQFDRALAEAVSSKIDRKTMLVKVGII
ncbi:hypothetical protein PybrP1_002691 [[Pythium] brassicae (nom. inval.)]|nr:hypothetical protein PybrP1_002691 [[Pythium] brassicae (nom. inval.)]